MRAPSPRLEAARHELSRLRKALRQERARGRQGHWSYDLTRHLALANDVRRRETELKAAENAALC